MKTLVLADRPVTRPIKEILADNPDIELIITLGDLYFYDIQELSNITYIPKIGVYGNHCDGRYMETLGISNLHLSPKEINGVSFIGYQGCVKYKESDLQTTQEYCQNVMRSVPRYDVLIAHCPPHGINNNDDPAHIGFDGLREYIDRVSPRYVFHGHTYDKGDFIEKYKDTEIIYVHQERIIDIDIHCSKDTAPSICGHAPKTPEEWLNLARMLSGVVDKEMDEFDTINPEELIDKLPILLSLVNSIASLRGQEGFFLYTRPDNTGGKYSEELYKLEGAVTKRFENILNRIKEAGLSEQARKSLSGYLVDFWFPVK